MNSIMPSILNRRSVRAYTSKKVGKNDVLKMITAAKGVTKHIINIWMT